MFRVFATHGALLWGERNKCEARSLVYHVLKVYLQTWACTQTMQHQH